VDHARKLIRDRVTTTLSGLATTGANAFKTRVYPIATASLPGLAIYTKEESVDHVSMGALGVGGTPRLQLRDLSLTVEIFVKGISGYDDIVDQICEEIEEALYADSTLGGYAQSVSVATFSADFIGEADQPLGFASLTISVQYQTREGSPGIAI
tara:strand:+ start:2486 stop:2947 length:462 start_codon:yes stop_codon:yes gene_type:complete